MGTGAVIRVAALTSGRRVPSARFRVRQHIEPLANRGIHVREWAPALDKNRPLPLWPSRLHVGWVAPVYGAWEALKASTRLPGLLGSHRADVTWLQRELLPGYPTFEGLLKRPVVFDVDDAIWVARPFGARSIAATARRAAVVVVGNAYLGEWFGRHATDVRIVPTTVDTDRFRPASVAPADPGAASERGPATRPGFVVGWTGTAGNLAFLEPILPALRAFMADHGDVRLRVIADRPPALDLPPDRVRFVPWSPAVEAEALQDVDVGIMPLPDTEWTRGKCGFKLLQYMATGLPVVASPVGVNRDILSHGEVGFAATTEADWRDALETLYRDAALRAAMGREGRDVVRDHYDRRVAVEALAAIFDEVA